MRLSLCVLAIALAGCETYSIVGVNGPDGLMLEATCYDGARDCYNGAASYCGGAYHVLDQAQGDGGAMVHQIGTQTYVQTYSEHRVYFRCGKKESEAH